MIKVELNLSSGYDFITYTDRISFNVDSHDTLIYALTRIVYGHDGKPRFLPGEIVNCSIRKWLYIGDQYLGGCSRAKITQE